MVQLSNELTAPKGNNSHSVKMAWTLFQQSGEWAGNSQTIWRGKGFVEWARGNDQQAFATWEHLGLSADDYVTYGSNHIILHQDREEAFRWFRLAKNLDPTNKRLWRYVGRLCQNQFEPGICDDFLNYNGHNWFVDSDFMLDQAAWRLNRTEGVTYGTGECPEKPKVKCAITVTIAEVPDFQATWFQCLNIEAGIEYRFSGWIRVEAQEDIMWRPLYFQGNVNGSPQGSWPGNQTGTSGWTYWDRTFIAPKFDDQWACFHPVRIGKSGKTWFYNVRLKIIQE